MAGWFWFLDKLDGLKTGCSSSFSTSGSARSARVGGADSARNDTSAMIGPQAQANPDDTCAGDILLEPTGNVPTGKYQKIITRVIEIACS